MKIQLATSSDIDSIIQLIELRINWMNEQGIEQWNKSGYLETFTLDYFNEVLDQDNLYIVKSLDGTSIGAFTLFDEDRRWNDIQPALYIHNFVSHIGYPGVGDTIINCCEQQAKAQNKNLLRIDCQQANEKLNSYYAKRGFVYIDSFEEENYSGNRREKEL